MRLVKQHIEPDGSGAVTMLPDEPEDMWHVYNLIRPSDLLTASAIRRVTAESAATGSTSSHRVYINLTVRVKSLDFDPKVGQLHISGRVARETKHTKIGQYHTLDLELNRNFTLEKEVDEKDGEQGWDSVAREQLAEAISPQRRAEIIAAIMEDGLANICFITESQTILRQTLSMQLPKKRGSIGPRRGAGHSGKQNKRLDNFFRKLLESLLRQVEGLLDQKGETENIPILLASPGFTAANFHKYVSDRASAAHTPEDKILQLLIKRKVFVVAHSSSGHLHSLTEVMKSKEVMTKLEDTKYSRETRFINDFFELLRKDDGRAWYGHKECEAAAQIGAVGRGGGILIISNSLFRSYDVGVRRRWVTLADKVRREDGGEVRILSSDHDSGKRLDGLGGVAAILTYPIADLELSEDDEVPDVNENDP